MLMLDFIQWWYGNGWRQAMHSVSRKLRGISVAFSVSLLLRTLFAPWRRVVTPKGRGLDAHIQAMFDNLIGRFVGFTVRLFVLVAALISSFAIGCYGIALILLWPLVPFLAIASVVWGLAR